MNMVLSIFLKCFTIFHNNFLTILFNSRFQFDPIDFTFSTDEEKISTNLQIFPNPSSNLISFTSNISSTSFEVMDASGVILAKGKLSTKSIDISSLRPGVYYLKINNGIAAQTGTFIKL